MEEDRKKVRNFKMSEHLRKLRYARKKLAEFREAKKKEQEEQPGASDKWGTSKK